MAWAAEPKFDLVVGDRLNDLHFDAVPHARSPADDLSGIDLDCAATHVANLGVGQPPGSASDRLPAFIEAGIAAQELYPWSGPRILEGAGVRFVEVDMP